MANQAAKKYFNSQARFVRRDLRMNYYKESELPQVIADIWRDDEDELRRSYAIGSLAELKKGIMSAFQGTRAPKTPAKKKVAKKAAKKPVREKHLKANTLVSRACRSKKLPAFLRKFC